MEDFACVGINPQDVTVNAMTNATALSNFEPLKLANMCRS
jgi:hypothetical protein